MLRLVGIIVSIGLADSLNPTTIAPALFLASGERPRENVTEFTLAVFGVYLLGGAAIALGPGQLLLSLVPRPHQEAREILEVVAGAVLIVGGLLVWRNRNRLAQRNLPASDTKGKSGAVLGATITAVELPTAFPYFAAIAAIVGSGLGPTRQVILLVLFNLCFVLPLVLISGVLWLAGDHANDVLANIRDFLQRHWPTMLAVVALVAGTFVILLGTSAIAAHHHGRFGRFARRVNRLLHLKPP
ncbi:MAG: GAP family protein [Solirubrobacteraceae bacterium]